MQQTPTVIVPIYPLIPEGSASKVIPAMTDFVSHVVKVHDRRNVAIYGDSAGGNIALAVTQAIHRRRAPQVARMVLLSPVPDALLSNPRAAAIDDPVLDIKKIRPYAVQWAGERKLKDPLVSPLFGSFEGLPRTTIYAGSREIFAPDILRLHARACADDADFRFVLQAGALHDWPIAPMAIPEANSARPQLLRELIGR